MATSCAVTAGRDRQFSILATTKDTVEADPCGSTSPGEWLHAPASPISPTIHIIHHNEHLRLLAANLSKIPSLSLDETTRVRAVFESLMPGRENMTLVLELRVVLAELGLYPSDEEVELLMRAFHGSVNFGGLCHYLRFYKRERQRAPLSGEKDLAKTDMARGEDDDDTLKAFIALGGHDDGSGDIETEAVREAVRRFPLTIDIDGMIDAVDVHHTGRLSYDDFCAMWSGTTSTRRHSEMSFATLNPASPSSMSTAPSTSATARIFLAALGHSDMKHQNFTPESINVALLRRGWRRGSATGSRQPSLCDNNVRQSHYASRPRSTRDKVASLYSMSAAEEHLLLLKVYLFPEKYEAHQAQWIASVGGEGKASYPNVAKVASTSNNTTGGGGKSAGRPTASTRGAKFSARSRSAGKSRRAAAKNGDGDDDFPAHRAGVYRPPSPIILSLRKSVGRH